MKSSERDHRTKGRPQKIFDVQCHLKSPLFREFINFQKNKASLLHYICETSSRSADLGKLFLAGGFKDISKSVMMHISAVFLSQLPMRKQTLE